MDSFSVTKSLKESIGFVRGLKSVSDSVIYTGETLNSKQKTTSKHYKNEAITHS